MTQLHPLNAILELLKGSVAAPKLAEAEMFTRALLARTPAEELAEKPSTSWAGMAVSLLKFWRERKSTEIKVRVYNPNLDEHGWESTDRKSTRLNSSHLDLSRMPSSA